MNSVLEGMPLHAYGHSYLAEDFFGASSTQRYINRVARRQAMVLANHGVSGYQSQDAAYRVMGTWSPANKGVAVIDCAINDALVNGTGLLAVKGFKGATNAMIQRMGAKTVIESNAGVLTQSGGTLATDPAYSGGEVWIVPNGGQGWIQGNVSDVDSVTLGHIGLSQMATSPFEVLVDGVVVNTLERSNVYPTSRWSVPQALVVPLPNRNAHTVKIRSVGPVTNGPFFDWMGLPAEHPLPVILMAALPIPNVPNTDAYNNALMELASSRSNVFFCDTRVDYVASRMIGPDNVHLSPEGQAHVADHLDALLDTITWAMLG